MYAAHYGLSDVGALYEFTFYLLTYLLTYLLSSDSEVSSLEGL